MEPLSTAAIAIGSVVATKALEKTGEKVGEALWNKTSNFLVTLKKHSPHTITAIEKAQKQPLDYGKAILEVESAATKNVEVNQAMQDVALSAGKNPPSNLAEILKEIKASVEKSQQPLPSTFIQNISKAINAAQNQNIDQRGSTFHFDV